MGLQMFHGIEESQRLLIKCRVTSFSSLLAKWAGQERRPLVGQLGPVVAAVSTAGRDGKWSTHSFGGKETSDRIKVLKMGLGDSRSLGSRALFLRATSPLFSILARGIYLCYKEVSPTVSLVTSPILLITLNYLFHVQGLSPSWRS